MKSIHVLAQNSAALRDFCLFNVQGQASIAEDADGLPANSAIWDWEAVPDWLTTATTFTPAGDEVPRYRVRPGWRLEGWRGNDPRLPISWFTYDQDGNVSAEPTYAPGVFLIIQGPDAEFTQLLAAVKAQDAQFPREQTVNGQTIRFARIDVAGGWVRLCRPSTVQAALAAWGVPGHEMQGGDVYDTELEA